MVTILNKIRASKGNSHQHQRLCEDVSGSNEPVLSGVTVYVSYLGSCLVDKPTGEETTAGGVRTIVKMAKTLNKKLPQVALTISLRGIRMIDTTTNDLHLDFSIYRISYCSVDPTLQHVFTFIATNQNLTMECHAFLCHKKKIAQSTTLTIAQAFNLAFEEWLRDKDRRRKRQDLEEKKRMSGKKEEKIQTKSDKDNEDLTKTMNDDLLIDFDSLNHNDDDTKSDMISHNKATSNIKTFFEEETEEMDLSFTQIAKRNEISILAKLPTNSSSLELGCFLSTDSDSHQINRTSAETAQIEIKTKKECSQRIWS